MNVDEVLRCVLAGYKQDRVGAARMLLEEPGAFIDLAADDEPWCVFGLRLELLERDFAIDVWLCHGCLWHEIRVHGGHRLRPDLVGEARPGDIYPRGF
jgi:hypothetical protein